MNIDLLSDNPYENENHESKLSNQPIDLLSDNYLPENKNMKLGNFNSLEEIFNKIKQTKPLIQSQALREIPPGIKEGFHSALSAIPKVGQYAPSMAQQQPVNENIKGAPFARGVGKVIGATPVIAGIGAPLAVGAASLGVPATAAALGGAAIGGGLTTSGDLFHRGVGALEAAAPIAAGKVLSKLPNIWKTLRGKVEPEQLVRNIQKGHDISEKEASDIFDFVKNEVKPREVGNINLEEDILKQARESLPKTRAHQKLIERAESGDYDSLHDLQSELGKKGRAKMHSDSVAEQYEGEEMLDLRNRINEEIEETFRKQGHNDLADQLLEARQKWTNLKKTYYEHPTIGRMVSPETRKVPKNPLSVLSEESNQMKRIHEAHPEIPEMLKLYNEKKKLNKQLKHLGIGGGSTLPNIAAIKYLMGQSKKPLTEEIIGTENQEKQ